MAKSFNGSNKIISSKEIFDEKTIYNTDDLLIGFSEKYANFVFFNLFEFQLYGKVARIPIPITLRASALGHSTLKQVPSGGPASPKLVNFVADAFADFIAAFTKKQVKGELVEDEAFLSSVVAYKGYKDPYLEYTRHRQQIFNAINQHIRENNKRVRNFHDFMMIAESLFHEFANKIPVTMAGFVKSRFCTPLVSGLVVEISNLEYDIDQREYDAFLSSPNFEFYLNNALEHGFYVDAGAPWRLIADLSSPAMARYMKPYGLDTSTPDAQITTTLQHYYDMVAAADYQLLRRNLVGMWNSFVGLNPYDIEPHICPSGETKIRRVRRREVTMDYVSKIYPKQHWFWMYMKIRNFESNNALNDEDLRRVYENLVKMVDKVPMRDILLSMEAAICDVSDESGSYHHFAANLTQQEKFEMNIAISRGARDISSY